MEALYNKFAQNYDVSRETFLQLTEYVEILKKWQRQINLISNSTLPDIWERHIEDSLQLIKFVPRETAEIIDIGSGGGLPGLILAIYCRIPVHLVESDMKKCNFLAEAARQLGLTNCKIYNKRAEEARVELSSTNNILITARALAEITEIFALANNISKNNNISHYNLLLPKGRSADIEISKAKEFWEFDLEKHQSVTEKDASILVINHIRGD